MRHWKAQRAPHRRDCPQQFLFLRGDLAPKTSDRLCSHGESSHTPCVSSSGTRPVLRDELDTSFMEGAQPFLGLGARSPSMNASILNGADAALSGTEHSPVHRCKLDLLLRNASRQLLRFQMGVNRLLHQNPKEEHSIPLRNTVGLQTRRQRSILACELKYPVPFVLQTNVGLFLPLCCELLRSGRCSGCVNPSELLDRRTRRGAAYPDPAGWG